MLVNNLSQCKIERERTGLFFVLSCSRIASRIDVSAFDRDRGSSPCYWALEAAASPHKDRTRWNNAIFAEEEADGDEAAHSDAGKEIKKEGTPRLPKVVRRREKRRSGRREDETARETKNVEESDGLPAQNVDAASLSVTIVWMRSRRLESAGYLNAPRVPPPKPAERRKIVSTEKLTSVTYEENQSGIQSTKEPAFFMASDYIHG